MTEIEKLSQEIYELQNALNTTYSLLGFMLNKYHNNKYQVSFRSLQSFIRNFHSFKIYRDEDDILNLENIVKESEHANSH